MWFAIQNKYRRNDYKEETVLPQPSSHSSTGSFFMSDPSNVKIGSVDMGGVTCVQLCVVHR